MSNQAKSDAGAEIKACERAGRAGQEAIRIGISTAACLSLPASK